MAPLDLFHLVAMALLDMPVLRSARIASRLGLVFGGRIGLVMIHWPFQIGCAWFSIRGG